MTVRGTYHQVGSFLGRLANLERIVNVSDISLVQPNEKAGRKKKVSTPVMRWATQDHIPTSPRYTDPRRGRGTRFPLAKAVG